MCYLCMAAAAAVAPGSAAAAAAAAAHKPSSTQPQFIVASFVSPVLVTFFGVNVYSYGLMVAAALGIAFFVFGNELRRARIKLDEYMCFFVFLAGFAIGSKSHLALSAFGAGEELTWKAFDIRTGHSFIGSQLGAVSFMLIYIWRHNVNILQFLDVLLPCCLIGHVIGKGGCFLSGDGCYGPPADPLRVPWAMSFPNAAVPTRVPVHPTPIYESLCSGAVVIIVRCLFPLPAPPADEEAIESSAFISGLRFPKAGRRTALLLVLFGIERVIIENFRQHPPITFFGGLTEYQALAVMLLGIGLLIEMFARVQDFKGDADESSAQKKKKKKHA